MYCSPKTYINIPSFADVIIKELGGGYIMRLRIFQAIHSDSIPSCSLLGTNATVTH